MKKTVFGLTALLFMLSVLLAAFPAKATDTITTETAENAIGMYCYDFQIYLYNPCNSNDMDKDAVYQLWFDFDYNANNGYGAASTYRFDMSWNKSKKQNANSGVLKSAFIKPNDNECFTCFSVCLPGIVNNVKVHLNMDGGERLAFTVESISLNGYRINTNTDYVSSAYYDSDASISCHTPKAAIMCENGNVNRSESVRDQFGAVFSDENIDKALEKAKYGNNTMLYHNGIK